MESHQLKIRDGHVWLDGFQLRNVGDFHYEKLKGNYGVLRVEVMVTDALIGDAEVLGDKIGNDTAGDRG